MRSKTFSVYNEGVTWVVGLSAATAGGAFLHYETLSGAPPFVRALFFLVVGCFLGTVGVGVQYAFWLYYVRNERDREQQLREREKSKTETADPLDYYRELQAIANHIEEARKHVTNLHKYLHWLFSSGLIGAAILFGLALIAGAPTHAESGSTKQCCEAIAKFSNQLEKALIGRISSGSAPPNGTPPSTDVKLDPQLQQALWQHVQKPAPATSWTPWILLAVVGVLAAGALIAFVSTKKPEVSTLSVAVTIFGTVTAFVVKLAAQKPHMPSGQVPFWIIAVSLTATGVGALLIVDGLFQLRKDRMTDLAAPTASTEEERKERTRRSFEAASLLVYGFSALLVALVPAMVFNGDDVGKKPCLDCSHSAVMPPGELSVSKLSSMTSLGDGDEIVDSARIQALISNASSMGMKSGDILLLLGSADCRAVKKGGRWPNNEALAAARANSAMQGLDSRPELSGVRVQAKPLPQHIGCAPSPDVRAVYPFLIQSKQLPPIGPRM